MSDCEMPPRTSCSAHPTASESSSLMETLRFFSPEGRKGVTAPALATTGSGDARRQRQIVISRMIPANEQHAPPPKHGEDSLRRQSPRTQVGPVLAVQPPFSDTLTDRPGRAAGPFAAAQIRMIPVAAAHQRPAAAGCTPLLRGRPLVCACRADDTSGRCPLRVFLPLRRRRPLLTRRRAVRRA